jgi:hypothetical protein
MIYARLSSKIHMFEEFQRYLGKTLNRRLTNYKEVESFANGMKLLGTYYHIKGYGSACHVHPRAVKTGPC